MRTENYHNQEVKDYYLDAYILSGGVELPPDIKLFQEGEPSDHLCFLCRQDHFFAPEGRAYGEYDKVRTCAECEPKIKNIPKSYINKRLSTKSIQRINEIYSKGIYPDDMFGTNGAQICGICRTDVNAESPEYLLPVGKTKAYYDTYRVCEVCEDEIGEAVEDPLIYDSCCEIECHHSKPYAITEEERSERLKNGSYGKHACPDCWFEVYQTATRYYHSPCSECDEMQIIDLSFQYNFKQEDQVTGHKCMNCISKAADSNNVRDEAYQRFRNDLRHSLIRSSLNKGSKVLDKNSIIWEVWNDYHLAFYPHPNKSFWGYTIIYETETSMRHVYSLPQENYRSFLSIINEATQYVSKYSRRVGQQKKIKYKYKDK